MEMNKDPGVYADAVFNNYGNIGVREESRPDSIYEPTKPKKRNSKKIWRIIAATVGAIILILVAIVLFFTLRNGNSCKDAGPMNNIEAPVASCDELRKRSTLKSGIYTVKPDKNSSPIEIYCDMETDGGGWSLVASIHDSDIQQKCYSDDLWSGYVPYYYKTSPGKTSWNNEMTFGTVQKCIDGDYKNLAYYSLNASNLMVLHVKHGVRIDQMRDLAKFRYRTDNDFLQSYGGNLKNLFHEYYPLEIRPGETVSRILNALSAKSEEIISEVPNWYNYIAGTGTSINDATIYESQGSRMIFRSPIENSGFLTYGEEYRFTTHSIVKTSVSERPFVLIGQIRNVDRTDDYYEMQMTSYGEFTRTSIQIPELEGEVVQGSYVLQYKAVQFIDPSKNVPCEMVFVVSNLKDWRSTRPSSFDRTFYRYQFNDRHTYYRINGNPAKVLFGYILLATQSGSNFTTQILDRVSRVILQTISTTEIVFSASSENTLTVPVVFDEGTARDMTNTIPPDYQPYVDAGYLQFRAYNFTGYPNAICPGIKVASDSPEYVCIGGISGDVGQHGTCGDFAGWGGVSTDQVSAFQPRGSAHALEDIVSTILLFYR